MATIHGCRWEWCRNVFNTHGELVDHVKSEHLLSMRPITKRNAAAMLRTEGYTPEEIAVRLIPGYVAASQASAATNDPPHQAPESSPPTQEPQLVPPPDPTSQSAISTEQPTDIPSPRNSIPLTTSLPTNSPEQSINPDDDILMPPSSPPQASPSPPPQPEPEPLANDMPIDQPELNSPKPATDFLVPVSSPPPAATRRSSSVGSRTPRVRRRSSFSQMSSSPPADEFTAPRYGPLPESPTTSTMIAERRRELEVQETERGRGREREKDRKDHDEVNRSRGSPAGTSEARNPESKAAEKGQTAVFSRGGIKIKRGRARGRGQPGLQISTPVRTIPPSATSRRLSPGLRIESRSTVNEPRRLATPSLVSQEQHAASQTLPMDTQLTLDSTATADQMISQYTHAGSDDEDMLDDLKANLDNPDWGLQTQAPYVSQTQNSYPSQTEG
ncbi:hypothetical protein FRC12_001174 [Ceratobasidium sp. 428]|nr:hypothetical protein FRC12_001174 [Ceratobasidium sp. 428]